MEKIKFKQLPLMVKIGIILIWIKFVWWNILAIANLILFNAGERSLILVLGSILQ